MVNQERTSAFLPVTCKCGRGLRAKVEQAGTEIRCWDCHQSVLVPIPYQGQRVARELSSGAMVVIQGPGMNSVVVAALLVTAVLAIPTYGTWSAVIVLTLGASAFGEIIHRVSRGGVDTPDPSWWRALLPRSIPRLLLCILMAAGTVVPLWIMNADDRQSPHWDGTSGAIAIVSWLVLPLLMVGAYAMKDHQARLGFRGTLKILVKHPFAAALALAVIPMTLLLLEVCLTLIFYIPGNLTFFALDYMPTPQLPNKPVMYDGVPYYDHVDYRLLPEAYFIEGYRSGIRHGYTFVAAIPASLANPTRAGMGGESIGISPLVYRMCRVLIIFVVVVFLIVAFAVQARWLGSIPALERGRPGSRIPEPSSTFRPAQLTDRSGSP